jgi:DNA-binding HxlR family transcriptional regulator
MTLDLIGDRWTVLIIRDLYFGARRFSDLLTTSPGLSTRILAERLKLLEAQGFIQRVVYSEHPLRAEYHLTDRGLSLEPVLGAIADWGLEHLVPPRDAGPIRKRIDTRRRQHAAARAKTQIRKKAGADTPAS